MYQLNNEVFDINFASVFYLVSTQKFDELNDLSLLNF